MFMNKWTNDDVGVCVCVLTAEQRLINYLIKTELSRASFNPAGSDGNNEDIVSCMVHFSSKSKRL
jgi:hypothetical protein